MLRKPWEMDFPEMAKKIKTDYPKQEKEIIEKGYKDVYQYFRLNIKAANDWYDFLNLKSKKKIPELRELRREQE